MAPGFDLLSQSYMARLCFVSVVFIAENFHCVLHGMCIQLYHSFVKHIIIRTFQNQLLS